MRKHALVAAAVLFGFAQLPMSGTAKAGVRFSTKTVYHKVRGRDAIGLVDYMFKNPVIDGGAALASLETNMKLRLLALPGNKRTRNKSKQKNPSGCHVDTLDFEINFTMTLPRATDENRLDRKTRKAWRAFRATAKTHENTHRAISMEHFRRFEITARKMTSDNSCNILKKQIKELLKNELAKAEAKHRALDIRDARRAPGLPLFKLAGVTRKEMKAYAARASRQAYSVSNLLINRSLSDR